MAFTFNDASEKEYLAMLGQCVKKNKVPNYFARYGLIKVLKDPCSDPLDNISNTEIETAIATLIKFWNKNRNNPLLKPLIDQMLKDNTKVKDSLLDSKRREEKRRVVEAENRECQEEKFKKLDSILEIIAQKGYITPDEYKDVCKKLSKDYTEETINQRIQFKKIKIKEGPPPPPPPRSIHETYPDLESSFMQSLKQQLNVFGRATLYDFLEVSKDSSTQQIQQRFSSLQNEWGKRPVNNEKTAAQIILGAVKTVLIEGDPRKYHNSIMFESMAELNDQIDFACSNKMMDKNTFSNMMTKAVAKKVEENYAKEYISWRTGGKIEPDTSTDTVKCPFCYLLNDTTSEHCRNCGESLYIMCPRCKNRERAADNACPKCGLIFKNIQKVKFISEEARFFQSHGMLQEALEKFEEANKLIEQDEDIEKNIKNLKEELTKIHALIQQYQSALFEKRLYTARDELKKLYQKYQNFEYQNKSIGELYSELRNEIEKIEEALRKTKDLERAGKNDDAIRAYESILGSCRDCEEARQGLGRIPPEPPGDCSVSYISRTATLQWKKSPSIGDLSYQIIRKEHAIPTSVKDGTLVTKTKYLTAEDTQGSVGHNYFYAVFSERGDAFSLKGAYTGSVLFIDDVQNFTLQPGDGVVEGSWTLPGDVKRVVAFKTEGATSPQSGVQQELPLLGLTKFVDRTVKNGHMYTYRILCEFLDTKGVIVRSRGIEKSVTPNTPPPALFDFSVTKEQSKAIIQWKPLQRGSVVMFKSSKPHSHKEGAVIAKADLALGEILSSPRADFSVDPTPGQGLWYYTPATIEGDIAVIGRTQKITFIDDISGLRAENRVSNIQLKWKWPAGCSHALVSWRPDNYPVNTEDPKASKEIISKGQYELKGAFQLNTISSRQYFFKVFAGYTSSQEQLFSSGIDTGCITKVLMQSGKIRYSLKKTMFRSNYSILLTSDAPIAELPEIVVIAKAGKVPPLNRSDGRELSRINGRSIGPKDEIVIDLSGSSLPSPSYIKVFFSSDDSYQVYQINHPGPDEACIK